MKKKKEKNKIKDKKKKYIYRKTIEVKRIVKKWKIWNKKKKIMKFKEETKKLVSLRFYEWIHVFEKKASEKILML